MRKLTKQQIIMLHEILVKYSGGAEDIRDIGLLESALEAPFITDELIKIGLGLADGSLDEKTLLDFIIEHS